jgi:hypothetical protein
MAAIAISAAALTAPAVALADPGAGAPDPTPSSVGDGGAGGIAQAGQSICPVLVQPGSDIASNLTQFSGNGGFAPLIVGALTGAAIQAQCQGFVNSVANGNLPISVPGLSPVGAPDAGAAPPN